MVSIVAKPVGELWSKEAGPDQTALDRLEVAFLAVFGTFVAASWVSFTLAEVGLDRPRVILVIAGAGLTVVGLRLRWGHWRPARPGTLIGLLLPIALGVALVFPPDEWILGAQDPGVYVNTGAIIAKTGSIVVRDPVLAAVDANDRPGLIPFPSVRLPGFYLATVDLTWHTPADVSFSASRVVPHGFHLFPTVLAFGYSLGGIWPELYVTPILALSSLVGAYLLWRRLFGFGVAAVATSLLAISPAEVWFARYPAAEILAQLLLFGGLLAFVATIDAPHPWVAAVAGLGLGATHLTKIESVTLLVLLAAYFGYQVVTRQFRRVWFWFLIPYGLLVGQATVHAVIISNWYVNFSTGNSLSLRALVTLAGAIIAVVAAVTFVSVLPRPRDIVSRLLCSRRWEVIGQHGAPAVILVAAGFAYYVRPLATGNLPATALDPGQLAFVNDAQSFVRLGWFVTPIGLLLGTLGWMLLTHGERNGRTALPLLVFAADTFLYLDHTHVTPVYFWAARRWLTLVIPGVSLATAYFLVRLFLRRGQERIWAAVPLVLGAVLVAGLVGRTRPLLGYADYRGAIRQFTALAAVVPADAVVLMPDGDAAERLSAPLQFLFDRPTFVVPSTPEARAAAGRAAHGWLGQGKTVYWITTPTLPAPGDAGLHGILLARQHVALPEKVGTFDGPPGADGMFQQDLELWALSTDGG